MFVQKEHVAEVFVQIHRHRQSTKYQEHQLHAVADHLALISRGHVLITGMTLLKSLNKSIVEQLNDTTKVWWQDG